MFAFILIVLLAVVAFAAFVNLSTVHRTVSFIIVAVGIIVAFVNRDNFANWEKWIFFLVVVAAIAAILRTFNRGTWIISAIISLIAAVVFSFVNWSAIGLTNLDAPQPLTVEEVLAQLNESKEVTQTALDEERAAREELREELSGEVSNEVKKFVRSEIAKERKRTDGKFAEHDERITDLEERMDALEVTVNNITHAAQNTGLTNEQVAEAVAKELAEAGWPTGSVRVGSYNADENPFQVGNNPFVSDGLDSVDKLVFFVNGSALSSQAAREYAMKNLSEQDRVRFLSGTGFVPVQFLQDVCYDGNTFFKDGKAVEGDETCRKAGDVMWFFVQQDENGTASVAWDASVRADCGNPGVKQAPRPKVVTPSQPTPDKPKPTPTETPDKPKPTPTETPDKPKPTPTETPDKPKPTPTETPDKPKPTPTETPDKPKPTPTETPDKPKPTPTETPDKPKPTKNPEKHPCVVNPKAAGCPGANDKPAPAPTTSPDSTPKQTPPPVYTPPAPPKATPAPTLTQAPKPTTPPPPRETQAPAPSAPETSPSIDPCKANPDFC